MSNTFKHKIDAKYRLGLIEKVPMYIKKHWDRVNIRKGELLYLTSKKEEEILDKELNKELNNELKFMKCEHCNSNVIERINKWVIDRNLHTANPKIQMCKTVEELGELAKAINKNDTEGQMDGIGDVVVTLICISQQLNLDFVECLEYAYNEIKDRKGRMIGGTFVKESDL